MDSTIEQIRKIASIRLAELDTERVELMRVINHVTSNGSNPTPAAAEELTPTGRRKRKMSASGRAALSKATKARWRAIRAKGGKTL